MGRIGLYHLFLHAPLGNELESAVSCMLGQHENAIPFPSGLQLLGGCTAFSHLQPALASKLLIQFQFCLLTAKDEKEH